ncbi:single-stranded DNA-binding protein [Janthinobacterium sp. HH102]|uniref:single-stranded DNA-binding protein n=1 Tax=Janthinobacterium sp. HH102 TaxID=1537274 RepID=UPI0008FC94C7|nr:single-stranded DNA-binding protein [Janthinobacterium sp. HH102]
MNSLNKVILIGNVKESPTLRKFNNGTPVTNLMIATNDYLGGGKEITEWHRLQLDGNIAKSACENLQKGDLIYIEGSLKTKISHDKKAGVDRFTTEIVVTFLEKFTGAK